MKEMKKRVFYIDLMSVGRRILLFAFGIESPTIVFERAQLKL